MWLRVAEGSEQRQGRVARCLDTARNAWDGRGGETQASVRASGQAQVSDPRNPQYNRTCGLVAEEFIPIHEKLFLPGASGWVPPFGFYSARETILL